MENAVIDFVMTFWLKMAFVVSGVIIDNGSNWFLISRSLFVVFIVVDMGVTVATFNDSTIHNPPTIPPLFYRVLSATLLTLDISFDDQIGQEN